MKKVIILGCHNKKLTSNNIDDVLKNCGGVTCISDKDICDNNDLKSKYLLIKTRKLKELDINNGVIIINCNKDANLPSIPNCNNLSFLVNSENSDAIAKLSSLSIPAIVFGMCAKDTITLSSISHTDAIISIQREIPLQSGRILEPCEFNVRNVENFSDDEILMIGSVLILFENFKNGIIEF